MKWINQANLNHYYDYLAMVDKSKYAGIDLNLLYTMMAVRFRAYDMDFLPIAHLQKKSDNTDHWVVKDRNNNLHYLYRDKAKGKYICSPFTIFDYTPIKSSARRSLMAQIQGELAYGQSILSKRKLYGAKSSR